MVERARSLQMVSKMADKRRGDAGVRKRNSENKKMTEHLQLGIDSSDDEAPDEVTFEDSKAVALRSMKDAIDSARRDKELMKEKRRRKQQLFEEQKKRRRLPDEILEEIDSASSKNPEGPNAKDSEEVSKEEEDEGSDSQEEEEQEVTVTSGKKKKKRIRKRRIKGGYSVMRLQDQPVASKQQQRAAEFLQSRLYSRQSNRAPVNHFLSLENKRAQNKSAAVVFVSKQWGENQKTKAANFKKRWLHKRGMEAS